MSAIDSTSKNTNPFTFEKPSPLFNQDSIVGKNHLDKGELLSSIIEKTENYGESKHYKSAIHQQAKSDWILGFVLLAFSILAFIKAFQPKRVNLLISTLTNWKIGKQIIRYEKVHSHPVNIGLSIVFISASSLFIALCLKEFVLSEFGLIQLWLSIILMVSLYSLFKILIYKASAVLLVENELFNEYSFHTLLFSKLTGVICLVGIAVFEYSLLPKKETAIIICSISAVLFLFQLVRGVQIGQQKTQNLLSIILYLCTLEILPLVILSKWIIGELSRA